MKPKSPNGYSHSEDPRTLDMRGELVIRKEGRPSTPFRSYGRCIFSEMRGEGETSTLCDMVYGFDHKCFVKCKATPVLAWACGQLLK